MGDSDDDPGHHWPTSKNTSEEDGSSVGNIRQIVTTPRYWVVFVLVALAVIAGVSATVGTGISAIDNRVDTAVNTTGDALQSSVGIVDGNHIGDSVTRNGINITVTDVFVSPSVTVYRETALDTTRTTYTAPEGRTFAAFRVQMTNTDSKVREMPGLSEREYTRLRDLDDVIEVRAINDIRVYGGDEGGVLIERDYAPIHDALWVGDTKLPEYPASGPGHTLRPGESANGWTWAAIPNGTTPRLRIHFNDRTTYWSASGANLSAA
jgi:Flp pilus assembly pilin Flp